MSCRMLMEESVCLRGLVPSMKCRITSGAMYASVPATDEKWDILLENLILFDSDGFDRSELSAV